MDNIDPSLKYWIEQLKTTSSMGNSSFIDRSIEEILNIAKFHVHKEEFNTALDIHYELCNKLIFVKGHISVEVARVFCGMGAIYYNLENLGDSVACYEEALNISRQYFGLDEHIAIFSTLKCLGIVYFKLGDLASAEDAFLASMDICNKLFAPGHWEITSLLCNLAQVATENEDEVQAIQLYRQVLGLEEKYARHLREEERAFIFQRLGNLYELSGEYDPAIRCFTKAICILQDNTGSTATQLLYKLLLSVGNLSLYQSDIAGMMSYYIRASRISLEGLEMFLHHSGASSSKKFYILSNNCMHCAEVA